MRHCRTGSVGHRNRNGRSAPKYVPVRGTLDGSDIAPNQIAEAKRLSTGMEISYLVSPAENWTLPKSSLTALLPVSATGTLQSKGGSGICKASEAAWETVAALHGMAAIFRQDC